MRWTSSVDLNDLLNNGLIQSRDGAETFVISFITQSS